MKYQAIPNGDRFLELVKKKNDWGFLLGCFGFKSISDNEFESRKDVADFLAFLSEAEKIRRLHTGIENRQLYFGRKWDMLHYLLSENRRDNDAFLDENDWAYQAIDWAMEYLCRRVSRSNICRRMKLNNFVSNG